MDLESLIESASEGPLRAQSVQDCATALGVSVGQVFDRIAHEIANRYMQRECSWEFGDRVANAMFQFAMSACPDSVSSFAIDVYLAFDAGEWPPGPDYEQRTRALLEPLVAARGA